VGKETNVDLFRSKFDRDQRSSAGTMLAATTLLALQTPVPAHHGDDDGDEQSSAVAILAASTIDTRGRELERDEQTPVAHTDGRFLSPGAVHVEGLGLITESDETFEFNTTTPPSQRAPIPAHPGDAGGFLAAAFLVMKDPSMITAVAYVVPDPLPIKRWHGSNGLILCLIVVGIAVGVAVGVSGGSGGGSEPTISSKLPSTAPSMSPSPSAINTCQEATTVE
jgi:hypothetical protein